MRNIHKYTLFDIKPARAKPGNRNVLVRFYLQNKSFVNQEKVDKLAKFLQDVFDISPDIYTYDIKILADVADNNFEVHCRDFKESSFFDCRKTQSDIDIINGVTKVINSWLRLEQKNTLGYDEYT